MNASDIVGYAATVASTSSFAPQAWKVIRSRDVKGLSVGTYALTVTGFALWLTYGGLLRQLPLIITNGICLTLSGFIFAMLLLPRKKRQAVAEALDVSSPR